MITFSIDLKSNLRNINMMIIVLNLIPVNIANIVQILNDFNFQNGFLFGVMTRTITFKGNLIT